MKTLSYLFILGNTKYGGDVLYVQLLSKALLAKGHNVDVLTQDAVNIEALKKAGNINVVDYIPIRREINFFYDFCAIYKTYILLKRKKYNIVHTNTSKGGFVGRIACKIARIEHVVHTVHGFSFHEYSNKVSILFYGFIEALLARISDFIIFVNNEDRLYAIEHKICKSYDCKTIFNVSQNVLHSKEVNSHIFDTELSPLIKHKDKTIFLSLARLSVQKDPLTMLRAICYLRDQLSVDYLNSLHFVFAGNGPLYHQMIEFINFHDINQYVSMLGHVKNVSSLLNASDVLISSSLYEGLPMTILEALSENMLILPSNCKGNRECFPQNYFFYFTPKDYKMLAIQIIKALKFPDLVAKAKIISNEFYKLNFPPGSMQQQTLQIYDKLILSKENKAIIHH